MIGNLLSRFLDPGAASPRAARPTVVDPPPSIVEESLRFEAPVMFLFRTAREDVELGGCRCTRAPTSCSASAQRTKTRPLYPDGETFRLDLVVNPNTSRSVAARTCASATT